MAHLEPDSSPLNVPHLSARYKRSQTWVMLSPTDTEEILSVTQELRQAPCPVRPWGAGFQEEPMLVQGHPLLTQWLNKSEEGRG